VDVRSGWDVVELYAEKVRSQSKGEVRIRSERKATKQRRGALYVERKRERERDYLS
jgi:acyl-homoserine lactone acylase PvdQ